MADQAGFLTFIRNVMGVPVEALPDDSPVIGYAYHYATEIVSDQIGLAGATPGWTLQDLATYNLAGDTLVNYCPDQAGSTYFTTLREKMGLNNFLAGVVQGAADQGTSMSALVPDFFKGLTMSDLMLLKTPWGRAYMGIAMKMGSLWGLT